ncbi:uncharacterized protein AMSG_03524 [Thecamonas trahens ATCC 50062]|uniref:Guanylate cyclase domain-containing protein n=1 Tax=Thecamonas trahens ATCC 50062 TaxID=461836 RepID=A0A0L0D741_THETB|nr:hypothetical protein AMSG_03524 [Thecamonas trahens ATCC 50062]KNC47098.1 hypothetical protein AMSG_03524 [Thecamonas trahens ATCC 50062]|eukprot:XP_013759876.1 hypothetical protein AMSG_03524 [Thecamonas trahens ATCC 50062]
MSGYVPAAEPRCEPVAAPAPSPPPYIGCLASDADACGVCYGNNMTCVGCDGVPNSGAELDSCGECRGDGSSCGAKTAGASASGLPTAALAAIITTASLMCCLLTGTFLYMFSRIMVRPGRTGILPSGRDLGLRSDPHMSWASGVMPPIGTVAILVADIASAGLLFERLAEPMREALAIYNKLFAELAEDHDGYISFGEGGFMITAFHTAEGAISFARRFQAELMGQDWPIELLNSSYTPTIDGVYRGLRVRMGITIGKPFRMVPSGKTRYEYDGTPVCDARILCAAAAGGQVVADAAVAAATSDAGLPCRRLGTYVQPAVEPSEPVRCMLFEVKLPGSLAESRNCGARLRGLTMIGKSIYTPRSPLASGSGIIRSSSSMAFSHLTLEVTDPLFSSGGQPSELSPHSPHSPLTPPQRQILMNRSRTPRPSRVATPRSPATPKQHSADDVENMTPRSLSRSFSQMAQYRANAAASIGSLIADGVIDLDENAETDGIPDCDSSIAPGTVYSSMAGISASRRQPSLHSSGMHSSASSVSSRLSESSTGSTVVDNTQPASTRSSLLSFERKRVLSRAVDDAPCPTAGRPRSTSIFSSSSSGVGPALRATGPLPRHVGVDTSPRRSRRRIAPPKARTRRRFSQVSDVSPWRQTPNGKPPRNPSPQTSAGRIPRITVQAVRNSRRGSSSQTRVASNPELESPKITVYQPPGAVSSSDLWVFDSPV